MDYQCYLIEETASEELKALVQNHKDGLSAFYEKILVLTKEFGAKTATLQNQHTVVGFTFDEVPKGWKKVNHICIPTKKALKEKLTELNKQSPHPYPIFELLQWQSFLIDGDQYDPQVRFIEEVAVLLHPVFAQSANCSLDLFKTDGLKEVTANELLRIRLKR